MAQMTTHPTDAEIAKIEQRARRYAAPAVYNTERLCAAARDRNRLEAENAQMQDTLQQIGFVCSDNAADSCDHRAALRFVAHLIDRTLSQLETPETS